MPKFCPSDTPLIRTHPVFQSHNESCSCVTSDTRAATYRGCDAASDREGDIYQGKETCILKLESAQEFVRRSIVIALRIFRCTVRKCNYEGGRGVELVVRDPISPQTSRSSDTVYLTGLEAFRIPR